MEKKKNYARKGKKKYRMGKPLKTLDGTVTPSNNVVEIVAQTSKELDKQRQEMLEHMKNISVTHIPLSGTPYAPVNIAEHEGKKYLREIHAADVPNVSIKVDVYCVLQAFGVTCPATAHAAKKLLTAGLRGKGSRLEDLVGAHAALSRAIEMEKAREQS